MPRWLRYAAFLGGIAVLWMMQPTAPVYADDPVVQAVLFYSPSCPHCHQVIQNDLPPLLEKYGDRLEILGIDTSQREGQTLYQAAIQRFSIPGDRQGVPTLVVDDVILVGSAEIPHQFPGLVEEYLAQGGVGWPDIPGLAEVTSAQAETRTATPVSPVATPEQPVSRTGTSPIATAEPVDMVTPMAPALLQAAPAKEAYLVAPAEQSLTTSSESIWTRVGRDPWGNGLAIIVLVGMVVMIGYAGAAIRRPAERPWPAWQAWAVPVLCLAGLAVAGYLAYVETAGVAAVCGPVGDCNTVQQSSYARLFGLIPIAVLGLAGYAAILIAWLTGRYGHGRLADLAWLALFGLTLAGTLFFIYLTFLEPFVIGAACAWCLTSAIIMTALLWLSIVPLKRSLARLQR